MKKLLTTLFILSSVLLMGQTYPLLLQQSSSSYSFSNSIATASDKSIIISGNNNGSITLGTNTLNYTSAYVTKYDSIGQNVWLIPAGKYIASGYQRIKMPRAILDNNNDIYVLGEFDDTCYIGNTVLTDTGANNSFLAKVNLSGTVIWAKKLTGSSTTFFDMALDKNGNMFLTGYLYGTLYLGGDTLISQGFDVVLLKLDNLGNLIWMKKAGGPPNITNGSEVGFTVSTDKFGNCYMGGYLRSVNPNFDSIVILNGSAALIGFVAKYDSSGNALWAKKCGYQSSDISSDSAGNSIVAGFLNGNLVFDTMVVYGGSGSSRAFVASINTSGGLKWARIFNADYSSAGGVATDNNGNCFVIGECRDTTKIYGTNDTLVLYNVVYPTNSNCGFIIKFDSIGNPVSGNLVQNNTNFIEMHNVNYSNCILSFTGNFGSGQSIYYNNDSLLSTASINGFAIVQDGCNSLTSINENIQSSVNIILSPNPFQDKLNITSMQSESMEIILYDITTRKILRQKFTTSVSISTEQLAKGIYLYEVRCGSSLCKKGKLVKD